MNNTKIIVLVEFFIALLELRHARVVIQLVVYFVVRIFDSGSLLFGIN